MIQCSNKSTPGSGVIPGEGEQIKSCDDGERSALAELRGPASSAVQRRTFLRSLGALSLVVFSDSTGVSQDPEALPHSSRHTLSFFKLPKQDTVPPFPPEWGGVAREILEVYPTDPKGSVDMACAKDIVRAQQEVMKKFECSVSNAAHELTHMLNSQAANLWGRLPQFANPRDELKGDKKLHWNDVQGVYLGEGRLAFVDHPTGVTTQMIRDMVPVSAKAWRKYDTYLIQTMGPESYHRAGYLLDELSAYCSGARTDLACYDYFVASNRNGRGSKSQLSTGHEEMAVFALAMAMAADRTPGAFRSEARKEQFMAVVSALVENAVHLESQLCDEQRFPEYGKAANPRISLRDLLRTNPDFAQMREWLDRKFGTQWYNSLLNSKKRGIDTSSWQLAFHEDIK